MPSEYFYGIQPILQILKKGRRPVSKLHYSPSHRSDENFSQILHEAQSKGIPCIEADRNFLAKLCNSPHHQGVVLQAESLVYTSWDQLHHFIKNKMGPGLLLCLDQIQDPHNLGAILRSALNFGVDGVILPEWNSVPVNATVLKTSAGAAEHLQIVKVTNLARTIEELKTLSYWVYGASEHAKESCLSQDFSSPTVLVLGNEGSGMRRLVAEHCDVQMYIPTSGPIGSLNVSVATGVLLFEVYRQRAAKK